MARSKADIVSIAMDAMGESPMDDFNNPRGALQRAAVRRYDDALEHVLQQARFSEARTQITLTDQQSAPSAGQLIRDIQPDPIIFTGQVYRKIQHLNAAREVPYHRRANLPENYGGKVWHVNGLEQGWLVAREPGTGAPVLDHNFPASVVIVYNRRLEPLEMGEAIAECVGLQLAMKICTPKDGDQNLKDKIERHYRTALRNAALVDDGGELEPLYSDWELYARSGGDYFGGSGY